MAWSALLDILYPRACAICGGKVDPSAEYLCWNCLSSFAFVHSPFCSICGDPIDGKTSGEFQCHYCSSNRPHFDRARSAARYTGVVQELLREFKYREGLWARRDLAGLLEACAVAHFDPNEIDAVTYVPLHPVKFRQRGFNQAEALAAILAKRLRKPLIRRCLIRREYERSQTNLTAKERATNVKGNFEAIWKRRLRGRGVMLVDDVMTTGATVNDCARALKEAGASRVYVVTVARG